MGTPLNTQHRHVYNRIHNYKAFALHNIRKGVRVIRIMEHANHHLPRRFLWEGEEITDLYRYLDAWCEGNQLLRSQYEKLGVISEMEFSETPSDQKEITISPHLLLSILRGEFPLVVSPDTIVRFRVGTLKGGRRFVASDFLAAIADKDLINAYSAAVQEIAKAGDPVLLDDMDFKRLDLDDYSDREMMPLPPDIHLREARQQGIGTTEPVETETAAAPDLREDVIATTEAQGITEVISLVHAERQYFVKRRYDREMVLLSSDTAWSLEGPWVRS